MAARRCWLVFDLNKTLATKHRRRTDASRFTMRPHVHECLRALGASGRFRLAIWTSGQLANTTPTVELLEQEAGVSFDRVLTRDDTQRASFAGAKPWDTIKPLAAVGFKDLSSVVMVDDSPHKARADERANFLFVPPWSPPEPTDGVFAALTQPLLDLADVPDVREHTANLARIAFNAVGENPPILAAEKAPSPAAPRHTKPRPDRPQRRGVSKSRKSS